MKKNMFVLIAALCAANGLSAIGTRFVNQSSLTINVNGAFGQDYTLAPFGEKILVSSNVRDVWRTHELNFETGIQDYLKVRVGKLNAQNRFQKLAAPVEYVYDMRPFKNRFTKIDRVTFNGDTSTLTVEGRFMGNKNTIELNQKNLKRYCDKDTPQCPLKRCNYSYDSKTKIGIVTDIPPMSTMQNKECWEL